MAPFYGWVSTVSRLESLCGGSLLFTTKLPKISGTYFIDLGRRPWSDPVVLNMGHLDWESSALTTRSLLDKMQVLLAQGPVRPPVKLAKTFTSNNTSYHGEIDAILLVIKHISSTQSKVNANRVHIFSDSIATINAITSLSPQEIYHGKMEEIIQSNLLKYFSLNKCQIFC